MGNSKSCESQERATAISMGYEGLKKQSCMSIGTTATGPTSSQMMMGADDSKMKRIKKDALWKPLFREFRGFYRSQINQTLSLSDVCNSTQESSVLEETLEQQSLAYLKEIGAPEHIVNNKIY